MVSGALGIRLFDEEENLFDQNRGKRLPQDVIPRITDAAAWDRLGEELRQAKWRAGSRSNYFPRPVIDERPLFRSGPRPRVGILVTGCRHQGGLIRPPKKTVPLKFNFWRAGYYLYLFYEA